MNYGLCDCWGLLNFGRIEGNWWILSNWYILFKWLELINVLEDLWECVNWWILLISVFFYIRAYVNYVFSFL